MYYVVIVLRYREMLIESDYDHRVRKIYRRIMRVYSRELFRFDIIL